MSTVLIVVIVAGVLVLATVAVLSPRVRERARIAARERELGQRRGDVAGEHRQAPDERAQQAELAERRARMAEQEATRERAEAQLEQERAELHERGLADHELVADDERERFAGTSAAEADPSPESAASMDATREPIKALRREVSELRSANEIGTVGDAYDNAMAESFVDSFKTELIADRVWRTRTQLELAVVKYVAWFNSARLHSSLGYQTSDEIETAWRQMPEPLLAQAASTPAFDGTAACGLAGTSGPINAD
jgi:hypothetical protein